MDTIAGRRSNDPLDLPNFLSLARGRSTTGDSLLGDNCCVQLSKDGSKLYLTKERSAMAARLTGIACRMGDLLGFDLRTRFGVTLDQNRQLATIKHFDKALKTRDPDSQFAELCEDTNITILTVDSLVANFANNHEFMKNYYAGLAAKFEWPDRSNPPGAVLNLLHQVGVDNIGDHDMSREIYRLLLKSAVSETSGKVVDANGYEAALLRNLRSNKPALTALCGTAVDQSMIRKVDYLMKNMVGSLRALAEASGDPATALHPEQRLANVELRAQTYLKLALAWNELEKSIVPNTKSAVRMCSLLVHDRIEKNHPEDCETITKHFGRLQFNRSVYNSHEQTLLALKDTSKGRTRNGVPQDFLVRNKFLKSLNTTSLASVFTPFAESPGVLKLLTNFPIHYLKENPIYTSAFRGIKELIGEGQTDCTSVLTNAFVGCRLNLPEYSEQAGPNEHVLEIGPPPYVKHGDEPDEDTRLADLGDPAGEPPPYEMHEDGSGDRP